MTPEYKAHLIKKFPDIMLLIEAVDDLAKNQKHVCSTEPILLTEEGAPFAYFNAPLYLDASSGAAEDKYVLKHELARIKLDDRDELNYRYMKRLDKLAGSVMVAIQQLLHASPALEGNNKDLVTQKETKKYH